VVGVVRAAATTVCEILAPGRGDELYSGYLEGEQYESALLKHACAIVSTAKFVAQRQRYSPPPQPTPT